MITKSLLKPHHIDGFGIQTLPIIRHVLQFSVWVPLKANLTLQQHSRLTVDHALLQSCEIEHQRQPKWRSKVLHPWLTRRVAPGGAGIGAGVAWGRDWHRPHCIGWRRLHWSLARAHAGTHGLVAGTAGRAGYTACVLPGFRVPGSLKAGGRLQRRISRPTLGARARANLKIAPICVPREPERSWVSQICGSLID